MGWPILEAVAVKWLNSTLAPTRASTDIPDDVGQRAEGFVRVVRGPGSDDGITDSPLLDVEVFHHDRIRASFLAERVREAVRAMSGRLVTDVPVDPDDPDLTIDVLIDSVTTATGPNWAFYGPNVERYVASYRIGYRRRPSAP